jgi:transcriptional regulator with XRE-family HTH domain
MTDALDWSALVREAKRRRSEEGLTQLRHAELAGVSKDTIRSFDRGETSITLQKAIAILDAVGLVQAHRGGSDQVRFVDEGIDRWERLIEELAPTDPARMPHGKVVFDYEIGGDLAKLSPKALMELLANVPETTGWPPFWIATRKALQPQMLADGLECWLGDPGLDRVFRDSAHTDFWRAILPAKLMIIRGYQEDSGEAQFAPGTRFDLTLPIWRAIEIVEHAAWLARHYPTARAGGSMQRQINVGVTYDGLAGRNLVRWAQPQLAGEPRSFEHYQARQDSVRGRATFDLDVAAEEVSVPAVVQAVIDLVGPLYAAFGITEIGLMVEEQHMLRESRLAAPARKL